VPRWLRRHTIQKRKKTQIMGGGQTIGIKNEKKQKTNTQLRQQKGTPQIIILPEYAVIDGNWISRGSGFAYAVQMTPVVG